MCPGVPLAVPKRHTVVIELDLVSFLDKDEVEKRVKAVIADANKCGAIKEDKVIVIERKLEDGTSYRVS